MTTPDPNALPFPKVGRTNKRGHESSCRCPACQGARNRRRGQEAQRKVAKALDLKPRFRGELAHEESWRDERLCWEVKSGLQVPRFFQNAYTQAAQARAVGDSRPVAVVLAPQDGDTLIVLKLSDFQALQEQQGPESSHKIKSLLRQISKMADEGMKGL